MSNIAEDVDSLTLQQAEAGSSRDVDADFAKIVEDQPGDRHQFYELESKVLDLWDRLNDLQLEIAVLEEQNSPESSRPMLLLYETWGLADEDSTVYGP